MASGALTLRDLLARGDRRLVVTCETCGRRGSYALARMIARHGPGKPLPELLTDISADCPRRDPLRQHTDPCGARYEGLWRPPDG